MSITNSSLTGADANGIDIINYTGSLDDVIISGNTLSGDGPGVAGVA